MGGGSERGIVDEGKGSEEIARNPGSIREEVKTERGGEVDEAIDPAN